MKLELIISDTEKLAIENNIADWGKIISCNPYEGVCGKCHNLFEMKISIKDVAAAYYLGTLTSVHRIYSPVTHTVQ